MAKVVYPVFLTSLDDGGYLVRVPDFHSVTEGDSLADAIVMARDLIGVMGIELEDQGKELPEAFSTKHDLEDGEIQTLVDVDLTAYRRAHDNKVVRKNCTIPNYLNVEAEKQGINFSRLLQEALQVKLGI